jgi:hypothetical protein
MYLGEPVGGRIGYRGVKKMEVHCINAYEDRIMKSTKYFLKEGGIQKGGVGL